MVAHYGRIVPVQNANIYDGISERVGHKHMIYQFPFSAILEPPIMVPVIPRWVALRHGDAAESIPKVWTSIVVDIFQHSKDRRGGNFTTRTEDLRIEVVQIPKDNHILAHF